MAAESLNTRLQGCSTLVAAAAIFAVLIFFAIGALRTEIRWEWMFLFIHAALVVRFLRRRARDQDAHLYNFSISQELNEAERSARDHVVLILGFANVLLFLALPCLWIFFPISVAR
jgi:Ca2+/Na+ antiporter